MGVEGTSVGWAAEVYSRWGTGVDVRLLVPRPEEGGYGVGINSGSVGAWYGINEAITFILEIFYNVRSVRSREELVDKGRANAAHDGASLDGGATKQVGEGERAADGRGVSGCVRWLVGIGVRSMRRSPQWRRTRSMLSRNSISVKVSVESSRWRDRFLMRRAARARGCR